MNKNILWIVMVGAGAIFLAGCSPQKGPAPQAGIEMQVVVFPAKRQAVSETLSLVGSIAANESVEIKAEADGIVQEIVFEEGKDVEKGQMLIRLDESKRASVLAEAEANFKLSQATFERSQQLYRDKLISQQEFDHAGATYEMKRASLDLQRRLLKDSRVYAPFKGTVGARQISPGQVITSATILTTLVDLDNVKAEVHVPERFLSQVRVGQSIEIGVAAYAGRKFAGRVYFVAPQVDETTRTALVKAMIPNPDHELRPGMFASLELTLTIRESALVIPEAALMYDGDSARVFLVDSNRTVLLRPISVGLRLPGSVEVVSGLAEGERVVVEGLQKVFPGARVRVGHDGAAGVSKGQPGPSNKKAAATN